MLALGIASAFGVSSVNAATYQVIDKGDVDTLKYTYSQQENNAGNMVISGTNVYNFPVQFQYLDQDDFDAIERFAELRHEGEFGLNDLEDKTALENGTPTANDLAWAVKYLQSRGSGSSYQNVGDTVAMTNFGDKSTEFTVFDVPFEGTDQLTRSTIDFVNGITNEDWVYGNGTAPYLPMPFVQSDDDEVVFWVREFTSRGYYSPDGGTTIIPVLPPETTYGGESAILDMSDSRYAVGFGSTSIVENRQERIDDETGGCADPDVLKDTPVEVCIQNIANGLYNNQALKWTLTPTGVESVEVLGQLVTPHEDDARSYVNVAQAVNSDGVTVGYSYGWIDEDETNPSATESRALYAVVFKDGQVRDFTEDHSKYFDSKAYDINDAGVAVGDAFTYVNGSLRTKFYHVDTTDIDNMTMVLPEDFFVGSSSTARAINESGIIVGSGEVETHNDSAQNPRRRHGFMYDINSQTFTDLNDLLPCLSDYSVIEAVDINDLNEISASAVVTVPRRDAKGELMLDENGDQLNEDIVRAVKLVPIAGEIEDCSKVEEKIERKGASTSFFALFSLFAFGFTRRFIKR